VCSSDLLGRRFGKLSLLCFLTPWATIAFPLLTGAVLTVKGFKLSDTLLYVGLANFGPVIGTLLAAGVIDRLERRLTLGVLTLAMGGAGLMFVLSAEPLWLILASAGFTMFGAVHAPTLNVYGAELFPTSRRASAVAGAWAFNRVGAAIAPLLLLPLLRSQGPEAMMAVIGLALLGMLAVLALSPPGRPGAAVA
jgi:putative MFS transporter